MSNSNNARTQAKTRTAAMLLAAATLVPAAALAQSGSGGGSSAGATSPMVVTVQPRVGAGESSSTYSMVVNDDGKTIKLEMKDGVVTKAEVDGQTIPDDRIENDGDVIRLKNEAGEVIYEHELPKGLSWNGRGFAAFDLDDPSWRTFRRLGSTNGLSWSSGGAGLGGLYSAEPEVSILPTEPYKAPPVMMGVQLGSPDSTLCGHLGLERENTTLLTGVHEGLPAANAGLEPYDLIVSINGKNEAGPADIRKALEDKKGGDTITLGVVHKGIRKDVTLTLEAFDRKKLSSAKADRIKTDENNDVFAIAAAPEAPVAPLPPLPPSIPDEYRKQIEQYYKEHQAARAPRAWTFNRGTGRGGAVAAAPLSDEHRKLLAEAELMQEQAAAQADQARAAADQARAAAEQSRGLRRKHGAAAPAAAEAASAEEMRERMERMEKMLEQLMNEKIEKPKSEEPKVKESKNGA